MINVCLLKIWIFNLVVLVSLEFVVFFVKIILVFFDMFLVILVFKVCSVVFVLLWDNWVKLLVNIIILFVRVEFIVMGVVVSVGYVMFCFSNLLIICWLWFCVKKVCKWFVIIILILGILINCFKFVCWIVFKFKKCWVKLSVVVLLILWIFSVYKNLGNVVCFVLLRVLIIFCVDLGFICFKIVSFFVFNWNKLVGVFIIFLLISCLIILLFKFFIFMVLWEIKCFNVFLCWVW